jgi:hypothetical protein
VLSDDANPSINPDLNPEQASLTYLWNRFPFSFTQSNTDTSDPWGVSDIEQGEELNIEINKTLSQLVQIKDRLSRIKIVNPKDSGVANSEFTNKPGILNPTSASTAMGIRYMEMPTIPPDLVAFVEIFQGLFSKVMGSFELEAIQKDGTGQIAYKSIAALLERAATMLRSKVRNYSKMIRERGRMYLSCAMNWYTEPRWISYEQDGSQMSQAINGSEMMIPAKLGVVSGSTMPVSRIQEREEALELFKLQAIDHEELLKKMDWADWKNVVARMKAGPDGMNLEKMRVMGFPELLLQALGEVFAMEQNDFEKAIEAGQIPPFAALLPSPEELSGEEPDMPPAEKAELEEIAAKIEKLMAEVQLIHAKIETEKVDQQVKMAGVEFDREKLLIERAKTVSSIQRDAKADVREDVKTVAGVEQSERQAQRDDVRTESELERSEQEAKQKGESHKDSLTQAEVDRKRADKADKREDTRLALETKAAEQTVQGPYREKGMSSNNKE